MERAVKNIVENALSLPSNSRAFIAEVLLESLDFEEDFPINQAWLDEIERRCSDIDNGNIELIPGEKGLAQLQEKFS
ncbi:MAG: addiction module protein [bacterium]|nr:addiction module protein [bacterium]